MPQDRNCTASEWGKLVKVKCVREKSGHWIAVKEVGKVILDHLAVFAANFFLYWELDMQSPHITLRWGHGVGALPFLWCWSFVLQSDNVYVPQYGGGLKPLKRADYTFSEQKWRHSPSNQFLSL